MNDSIYLGSGEKPQYLLLKYANRHGLITGATGTGKTVTLQVMAEDFSAHGVPVFAVDIKGDLSGIAKAGAPLPHFTKRAEEIGYTLNYAASQAIFWDVLGKEGHPLRVTLSEMGPLLLARVLELNETQSGVLDIVFAVADAEKLLLLDLPDFRAMLKYVSENTKTLSAEYGLISPTSVNAISRALLRLEQQGGGELFSEPALSLTDIMRTAPDGKGIISILSARHLMNQPKLYAGFMLWLLSELFEQLPEVGDLPKPRLVFFFDEAHLLFSDAPKALTEKIEQLVRLIRSKGVGVYFVTQNPADIPESVLAQLGARVQHALRAYTPQEQKAVRAAAQSFRVNPAFKTEEAITQLGAGEALVSTLDAKGTPSMVERTLIRPPNSFVGPLSEGERITLIKQSPIFCQYEKKLDRESAYELLTARAEESSKTLQRASQTAKRSVSSGTGKVVSSVVTSVIRAIGTQVARDLTRNFLRTLRK